VAKTFAKSAACSIPPMELRDSIQKKKIKGKSRKPRLSKKWKIKDLKCLITGNFMKRT
jgi:hypothetical protein